MSHWANYDVFEGLFREILGDEQMEQLEAEVKDGKCGAFGRGTRRGEEDTARGK